MSSMREKKIAVAVQRGVNDDGDRETDVLRTQHGLRQLVADSIRHRSTREGPTAEPNHRPPATSNAAIHFQIRFYGL